MDITPDSVLLTSHHHRDLAVRLQADKAVNDMAAGLLEHLRPLDIVLLVKTGLQLDKRRDLLSVLGGIRKRRDDRGMPRHTVQGHLDREHIRIFRCRADQIHDRVERLIGMMQEDIPLPDHGEQILISGLLQNRIGLGRPRLILQTVRARQGIHLHQVGQIQRTGDRIHLTIPDIKLTAQDLQKLRIHGILILEPDHLSPLTLLEFALDLLQQIIRFILVEFHIRVSRNAVRMGTDHVIACEQLIQICLDQILQQNTGHLTVVLGRNPDHAGQHRRNLNRCEHRSLLQCFVL